MRRRDWLLYLWELANEDWWGLGEAALRGALFGAVGVLAGYGLLYMLGAYR